MCTVDPLAAVIDAVLKTQQGEAVAVEPGGDVEQMHRLQRSSALVHTITDMQQVSVASIMLATTSSLIACNTHRAVLAAAQCDCWCVATTG
jgi:hypothetical protein